MRSGTGLVLAALAAASGAGAQEPVRAGDRLGLVEVVESALDTHPSVVGAAARVDAARAAAGEARASRLPAVVTSATLTRFQEPMVVAPLHGFDPGSPPAFDETLYQGHARADYTLFDGGARGARVRTADQLVEVAEAGMSAARDWTMAAAAAAYLAVLTAAEVRSAHSHRVTALETERARSALMFEAGRAPRVAVLRTEAALSRARAELASADERHELAIRQLARVSGIEAGRIRSATLVDLGPDIVGSVDRDVLVARALESNPLLRQADRRVAAAEARVAAARSAYLPRIAVVGRYSAFGSLATDVQPEWNAGFQVDYPLFTGGARTRAVEEARAEAAVAEQEARLTERDVAEAVDRAVVALRSAQARVVALDAAIAQTAEVARIEALALEAGAGVQTDYLEAEADLLEARAARAEARHEVLDARIRLALATGELTTDWLETMTEVEP